MPLLFTRDQIKRHLAELGYANLPENQLNVFIKDLKKLIKVEEIRHLQRRTAANTGFEESNVTAYSNTTGPDQTASTSYSSAAGGPEDQYDAWHRSDSDEGDLSHVQTENYRPTPDKKEPRSRPKTAPAVRNPSTTTIFPETQNVKPIGNDGKPKLRKPLTTRASGGDSIEPSSYSGSSSRSTPSSLYGFEFGTPPESEDDVRAPWKTKIKNLPPDSIRRDPVALYHYYKKFWDKQRAPGESAHMQLRWNVRAGTMGRVPCDPCGTHIKYLR